MAEPEEANTPPAESEPERKRQWFVGTIFFTSLGVALAAAVLLMTGGIDSLQGIAIAAAGFLTALTAAAVHQTRDLYRTLVEWRALFKDGGPDEVTVKSLEAPKGFLLRRDATVTLAVEKAGAVRTLERAIPIPITQAFVWRALGRVPTPFGRLTDTRELDVGVWRRRKSKR